MMDYLDFPMKFPWIGGCSPISDRPKIQASCITGILQEIMGCSCGFSHGSRELWPRQGGAWDHLWCGANPPQRLRTTCTSAAVATNCAGRVFSWGFKLAVWQA